MNDNLLFRGVKWGGAVAVSGWAQIPYLVQILIVFMAFDMATGILAAFIRKEVSSDASLRGVAKKTMLLMMVAVAHIASKPLGLGLDLGSVIAIAYVANELISIVENCARAGVPVPQPLLDALSKFNQGQSAPKKAERADKKLKVI